MLYIVDKETKRVYFVDVETIYRRHMSKLNDSQVSREIMIAAWAIALGAIAPMLDSTMINIVIKQLNNTFNTTIEITQWG